MKETQTANSLKSKLIDLSLGDAFANIGEELLAEGQTIVYCDDTISDKYMVEERPDGTRYLVGLDENDELIIIRELPKREKKQ